MAKQLTPIEAKLTLDASGVATGASQATASVGSMTKALVGSKLITGAMGAAVSIAGAAISGLASVVKQSVSAFADYEQQVGGIETLFGANGKTLEEYAASVGKSTAEATDEYGQLMTAQDMVMQNAQNAWKNQGLSANQYMQQVTGFAASLKQSTADSTEAAEVASRAMTDMADNANKFGTDIGSIQNAYQGFAKQNYTMLDNLKLGYGGTKEEMQRLINDAAALTDVQEELGIVVDANDMSFANVANAISVVQANMGIAGTTADEAMTTISGSAAAMQAAWQNTLAAMASGEGIDTAIENLVTSFSTFGENILPVIQTVLESMSTAIAELAPKVAEMLPGLVEAVLPNILSALTSLVTSIATMLGDPAIIDSIVQAGITLFGSLLDNLPAILSALATGVVNLVTGIGTAIGEHFPEVKTKFTELFGEIDLTETATTIFNDFKSGLSTAWESVKTWLEGLDIGGFISDTFQGAKNFISGLFGGGKKETETAPTETETETADSTVTMPTGVMTVDTAALNPVSEDVIASWQTFAEAITAVNSAIQALMALLGGGAAGAAGATAEGAGAAAEGAAGEGGGGSLTDMLTSISTMMTQVAGAAGILAVALGTTLVTAADALITMLCPASTDDEGNTKVGSGNNLYTSFGVIYGLISDTLTQSRNLAECWVGDLYNAAMRVYEYAGGMTARVQSMANAAFRAADGYNQAADAVAKFADEISKLAGMDIPNVPAAGGSAGGGARAEGGPVASGTTYLVGEEGPELFTPSRSGYIIPNDELASGGSDTVINVVFSGDVIGDEKSISAYVQKAVKAGIRQEVIYG